MRFRKFTDKMVVFSPSPLFYERLSFMSKKNSSPLSEFSSGTSSADSSPRNTSRRTFVKLSVAGGLGLCAIGAPICAGVHAVLDPAFQEGQEGQLYRVADITDLKAKPTKFPVIGDKIDAWTKQSNQQIGSVYLWKTDEKINAIHSLCPHAGCMVQFGTIKNPNTDAEEELFYCPCHTAHFDWDGARLDAVSPSPRDLDTLVTEEDEHGNVFVKFQNFAFGVAEKRS